MARVCKDYRIIASRFLSFSKGEVSRESVRAHLESYLGKAPKTYNNQLCALKAFIGRFLKRSLFCPAPETHLFHERVPF
jgi:hypothetical protein